MKEFIEYQLGFLQYALALAIPALLASAVNLGCGKKRDLLPKMRKEKKDDAEESENPEEYVPDAHYEPVVPLPDKVAVVTGEESEEVLFKKRCMLYTYNSETKEVKERGIGDIKILYNREKKIHRAVMHREQVHSICANFRITKGMKITDKYLTEGCGGVLYCYDYSDDSKKDSPTVFIIRFGEETEYEEFRRIFKSITFAHLTGEW